MKSNSLISVIIPAYNEEDSIGQVLDQLYQFIERVALSLKWEILVVDNGSTDKTAAIAKQHGARVIEAPRLGYGEACWQGVQASAGDVLLFVDGDGAVDFDDTPDLLHALKQGADLAIGVRSNPEPGSMTLAQRFGNQLACILMRLIWRYPVVDLGPFRALSRDFFNQLPMADRQYGWTIEMQLHAYYCQARVEDVPVRWRARMAGQSKIGGTVRGVFCAGRDIIGMIFKLWWQQRRAIKQGLLPKLKPSPPQ